MASLHNSTSSLRVVILGATLLPCIALRAYLAWSPLTYDEAHMLFSYIHKGVLASWWLYPLPNNHILLSVLTSILKAIYPFDYSLFTFRFVNLCCAIALVPLCCVVIKRLFNPLTAYLTTAIVSFSPVFLEYSFAVRGYTLQTVLFLVCLYCINQFEQTNAFKWSCRLVLATALGVLTAPNFLYAAPYLAFKLYSAHRCYEESFPKLCLRLFIRMAPWVFLLGMLPVHYVFQNGLSHFYTDSSFGFSDLYTVVALLHELFEQQLSYAANLLYAGLILALLQRNFTIIYLALSFLIVAILLQAAPPYTRVFVFVTPLIFALAIGAFLNAARKAAGLLLSGSLLVGVLFSSAIYITEKIPHRYPLLESMKLLKRQVRPGDVLVTNGALMSTMTAYKLFDHNEELVIVSGISIVDEFDLHIRQLANQRSELKVWPNSSSNAFLLEHGAAARSLLKDWAAERDLTVDVQELGYFDPVRISAVHLRPLPKN